VGEILMKFAWIQKVSSYHFLYKIILDRISTNSSHINHSWNTRFVLGQGKAGHKITHRQIPKACWSFGWQAPKNVYAIIINDGSIFSSTDRPHNPMLNAGAILSAGVAATLVEPDMTNSEKFDYIQQYFKVSNIFMLVAFMILVSSALLEEFC
jgi:hypothetical protein